MSAMMRTVICLFRNDLRLHDNEALLWAHRNGDRVVPLYCFDPDYFKGTWNFNLPKTGIHRARFMVESVKNLRENLIKVNSNLVVEHARPLDGIKKIVEHCSKISCPVVHVVYQKEVTYEELRVEDAIKEFCQSQDIKVVDVWGSSLYHERDVPFRSLKNVPDTYTQFRKEVESKARVRSMLEMPDKLKPLPSDLELGDVPTYGALLGDQSVEEKNRGEKSAFPFSGGETAALTRLNYYLWESHCVAKYKETRNGMIGRDYSTKFSPWLAHGCLSPRKIYWEIKRYEQTEVANQSTYWVIFEMIWRDYFKFVCQKYGDRVFYLTGILNKRIPWSKDKEKFNAWAEGRTGVPFVDANMRELRETGWMSNRGRQNVASFLVKDLGIDWRMGAEWFESQLLDHDVCSNYGNWNYAAGIGNDPRENRKFNMVKQGMDYDGDGQFVRLWVEELQGIKGGKVHVPWTISDGELRKAGVELGVTYPKPLIIAPEWNKHSGGKKTREGRGQKGIDFYFKSDRGGGGGGRGGNSGTGKIPHRKGKRLQ